METAIVSGLIKEIIKSLGNAAFDEIAKLLCVKKEIRNLITTLGNTMAQIKDADQIVARSEASNYKLKQLREFAYEAENIVDLFTIELGRQQQSRRQEWNVSSMTICGCCREVGIRCKTASDIHELNKKLEKITPGLLQELRREDQSGQNNVAAPQHDESITIGTDMANEGNNLIALLVRGNQADQCLFAIVGAVGVGKTTLARKIYHDSTTKNNFRTRLWVHVSNDSRKLALWSGEDYLGNKETTEQREVLGRHLDGSNRRRRHLVDGNSSRLLLVIDNVWEENGWNQFLNTDSPQHFCRRGIIVLVTTRHEGVARTLGIARYHRVRRLSEDDGWKLLREMANLREAEATGNIQQVGRRIVQKCSGLPAAVRTIGYHLRGKTRQDEWERVLSDDFVGTYQEIRDTIDTSYIELDYHLKRCFLYCSLYPEGVVIEKQSIMQLWIAEGFFSEEAPSSQEEKAERCYQELIDRSLLLPVDEIHGVAGANMPNLLRSFAIYRSQDENYVGNLQNMGTYFKPWRLSVANRGRIEDIPDDATSLRSLFCFGCPLIQNRAMDFIFNKLTSLRVLDLRDTQIETLHTNLERLKQLRYLNLSNTRVRSLPPSIGNLAVLQFLILKNCASLTSLPRHVDRLKHLRSLDVSGTRGLNEVHLKLHGLTELNCLQGFIPATSQRQPARDGWKFEELRTLNKLRILHMLKLERAASLNENDLNQLNLHEKPHLKELELWCSSANETGSNDAAERISITRVFEALRPAQSLVSLKLANYYGTEFPTWISNDHLTVLQRLTLDDCLSCQHLPPLGEMINLKFLSITGSNISAHNNNTQLRGGPRNGVAFPRLEQLVLGKMEINLAPWSSLQERDLPVLRIFHLNGCRQLTSIPLWLQSCTELASMKIQDADMLQEIASLPSLKELQIHNSSGLQRIFNMSSLADLKISNCPGLEAVNSVPLLCSVQVKEHTAQLPLWLQQQSFGLRRLEIIGTEDLLKKCSSAVAPYWSSIQDAADHVYAKLSDDGSLYFSYTRSTSSFHRSHRCLQGLIVTVRGSNNDPVQPPDNRKPSTLYMLYVVLAAVSCYFSWFFLPRN